jgi:hypothetical protein
LQRCSVVAWKKEVGVRVVGEGEVGEGGEEGGEEEGGGEGEGGGEEEHRSGRKCPSGRGASRYWCGEVVVKGAEIEQIEEVRVKGKEAAGEED